MSVVEGSGLKRALLITELPAGWAFPTLLIDASPDFVARYVDAVGAGSAVRSTKEEALVPPTALVALCLTACLEVVRLPSTAIHMSQEIEMAGPVAAGTTLSLRAVIKAKGERAGVTIIRVALSVVDASGSDRMRGCASLLIPSGTGAH